jgi:hypothetical protein
VEEAWHLCKIAEGKDGETLEKLVFGTVGKAFNRAGSMFILSYRPDFDYDHRQFPDYETFLPITGDWEMRLTTAVI